MARAALKKIISRMKYQRRAGSGPRNAAPRRMPGWLATLSPVLLPLVIAGVGWIFTASYNAHQLRVAELEQTQKLQEALLSGDLAKQKFAVAMLLSFDDEDLAIRMTQVVPQARRDQLLSYLAMDAIQTNDDALFGRITDMGFFLNYGHLENGLTPVQATIQWQRYGMLERLLNEWPGDTESGSPRPTILAARSGWMEGLDLLIARHAELEEPDSAGHTALGAAVLARHLEAAEALVNAGAKVDHFDLQGSTPLLSAVDGCRAYSDTPDADRLSAQFVSLLAKHGAGINWQDDAHNNAFGLAVDHGCIETLQQLYSYDERVYSRVSANLLETASAPAIVGFLLDHGVDPNAVPIYVEETNFAVVLERENSLIHFDLETPIGQPSAKDMAKVVTLFLSHHGDPNRVRKAQYSAARSPFQVLADSYISQFDPDSWVDLLRAMLDAGAYPDYALQENSETPLERVARKCVPSAAALLLNVKYRAGESVAVRRHSVDGAIQGVGEILDPDLKFPGKPAAADCKRTLAILQPALKALTPSRK